MSSHGWREMWGENGRKVFVHASGKQQFIKPAELAREEEEAERRREEAVERRQRQSVAEEATAVGGEASTAVGGGILDPGDTSSHSKGALFVAVKAVVQMKSDQRRRQELEQHNLLMELLDWKNRQARKREEEEALRERGRLLLLKLQKFSKRATAVVGSVQSMREEQQRRQLREQELLMRLLVSLDEDHDTTGGEKGAHDKEWEGCAEEKKEQAQVLIDGENRSKEISSEKLFADIATTDEEKKQETQEETMGEKQEEKQEVLPSPAVVVQEDGDKQNRAPVPLARGSEFEEEVPSDSDEDAAMPDALPASSAQVPGTHPQGSGAAMSVFDPIAITEDVPSSEDEAPAADAPLQAADPPDAPAAPPAGLSPRPARASGERPVANNTALEISQLPAALDGEGEDKATETEFAMAVAIEEQGASEHEGMAHILKSQWPRLNTI